MRHFKKILHLHEFKINVLYISYLKRDTNISSMLSPKVKHLFWSKKSLMCLRQCQKLIKPTSQTFFWIKGDQGFYNFGMDSIFHLIDRKSTRLNSSHSQ